MTKSFTLPLFAALLLAMPALAQTATPQQSTTSAPSPPAASATPQTTKPHSEPVSAPDQAKPGTQMRPSGNTTTMHTPGSENSQDQGPTGAPKA
jgi:hypothetical protein